MADLARALLLPPGINIVLLLLGLLLLPVLRRLALWLLTIGVVSLYLLATAPVAGWLMRTLENDVQALEIPVSADDEGAIVVIGAGRYAQAPEYGGSDTTNHSALMRLRYAAALNHQTGLPILASGGRPNGELYAEAELMDRVLRQTFDSLARWTEQKSRNTFENAVCSQFVLAGQDINHIFLVTHASHMPRAVYAFEQAGLNVTPAPTGYLGNTFQNANSIERWLPSNVALQLSYTALHERLGLYYYKLVYGDVGAGGVRARC